MGNKTNIKSGFSLIELMVVIAIVAVLSAVAVPAYKTYMAKVHITKVYNLIQDFNKKLALYREVNGSFPLGSSTLMFIDTPVTAAGTTIFVNSTTSPVTAGYGITAVYYSRDDANGRAGLTVQLNNHELAYLPPQTNGTIYNLRSFVYVDPDDTTTRYYCGWPSEASNGVNEIPKAYLPSTCTCHEMSTMIASCT